MSDGPSLLEAVAGLIERTYAMRPPIGELGRFVIGDRGLRLLYGGATATRVASPVRGARTLVRETGAGVRACVYYPDDLIRQLERFPPWSGLGEENVEAFAVLVEELDHLLLIGERAAADRPLTLLELELHADVTKELVLLRFLAGSGRRIPAARRTWLRHRLFEGVSYCDADRAVRERYRAAARYAVRLLDALPRLGGRERLALLRRFHAADSASKLALIERLAS